MSANATISCNWTGPQDVVRYIQAHNLSAVNIVQQCVNVCNLVFGSGNPDISGKGLMISYFCQAALTCLFGPLLPIIIWLLNLHFQQDSIRKIPPLLRKLQTSVYEINAFFCTSLLIAAVVRYQQVPSIMEVIFISALVNIEVLVIMSMLCASLYDHMLNENTIGKGWNIYYVIICFVQVLAGYSISVPGHVFPVYYELANECHTQRQFINMATYFSPTANKSTTLKWWGIGLAIGFVLNFLTYRLAKVWRWLGRILLRIIPEWLKRHGVTILLILFLLIYVYDILSDSIRLNTLRNTIQKISGDQFQDNAWGYGQTTAVLLWAPFIWDAIKEGVEHWKELHPSDQAETELQTLQPNAAPVQAPPPYSAPNGPPASARASTDIGNQPIPHNQGHVDDEDEPVLGIAHRDTEARIEGHGIAARTGTGAQATGQDVLLPRTLEGNIQHASTRQEANLQADPADEGLRRRFT